MEIRIRSGIFKRVLSCVLVLTSCWSRFPGILGQDAVVTGPIVSNACFGSEGVDLIANKITCSPGERVCIQSVKYGIKSRPDGSCPYAIAFSVSKDCCSPEPRDCLITADATKLSDLREECYFRSPSGCILRADRIDMQLACTGFNIALTFSTYRSITYSCVPESLIEVVEDPCLAVPEVPNVTDVYNATRETTQPTTTSTTQPTIINTLPSTDSETAPTMIGAIVGGALLFTACLILILLAIKLKRRKTKREAIASKEKLSEPGDDCAETGKHPNGIPYGHSPFYGKSKGFNVYVPYTKEDFKLVKTRPVVGVNVTKSSHKKCSRNVSQSSDGSNVSEDTKETSPKVTPSPPPGYRSRASSQGSRVHSAKSSPPDYRSRASSQSSRVHNNKSSPPDNRSRASNRGSRAQSEVSHDRNRGSRAQSDVSHDRTVSFEVPEERTLPTREYTGEWKKLTVSLDEERVHRF